jgi:hypothetical protein
MAFTDANGGLARHEARISVVRQSCQQAPVNIRRSRSSDWANAW